MCSREAEGTTTMLFSFMEGREYGNLLLLLLLLLTIYFFFFFLSFFVCFEFTLHDTDDYVVFCFVCLFVCF